MLKKFYVDNYKSLINVTFEPREINLLLGLNNAGKTTLCQAVRFASGLAFLKVEQCAESIAGGRQGLTNAYFDNDSIHFEVGADLTFKDQRLSFHYKVTLESEVQSTAEESLSVREESLTVLGPGFDSVTLIDSTPERDRVLNESEHLNGRTHYNESVTAKDATVLSRVFDVASSPRAKRFRDYLCTWQYYALSPAAMRGFLHRPSQWMLLPDGGNLASVIYHLKTGDERRYRQLLKHLKRIDDSVDVVNFQTFGDDSVYMQFEDSQGNPFPARNASEGTLRYLGLLYIFLAQPWQAAEQVVIVEEPENGLHVSLLRELVELAEKSATRPQVLFTSHSPYFIDLFEDRLDNVFLVKRAEGHAILAQPNAEEVKARLPTFQLGEQHFREMLG